MGKGAVGGGGGVRGALGAWGGGAYCRTVCVNVCVCVCVCTRVSDSDGVRIHLKQNEAQSARADESTHKGVNSRSKNVTQAQL